MKLCAFLIALFFLAKVESVALRGHDEEERALIERELDDDSVTMETLFLESDVCSDFMKLIEKSAEDLLSKDNDEVLEIMCSEHGRHELWKAEEEMKEDVEKEGEDTRRMLMEGTHYRRLAEATEEEKLKHCITAFEIVMTKSGKGKIKKTVESKKDCRKEIRQELRVVDATEAERRLTIDGTHRGLIFGKIWNKIKEGASKVVAVVTKAAKKVVEVAKVAVKKGVEIIKETGGKIIESALAGNFTAIGGHLREAGSKFKKIGKEIGDKLKEIGKNATNEALKIGTELANDVGDDLLTATKDAHMSAIKYAKKACNVYFGETATLGSIEGANSKCHELVKDAEEAGEKAIDKAAKEVVAIAEKVADAAEEEANRAIAKAQKHIDDVIEKGTKAAEDALVEAEKMLAKAEEEKDKVLKDGGLAIELAKKKVEEMIEVAKEETREALGSIVGDGLPELTETEFPCSPADPCDACEGDCDEDADCEGELKCMERTKKDPLAPVPGCTGKGKKAKDYCYAPGAAAA